MKPTKTIGIRSVAPYVCVALLCVFFVVGGISVRKPAGIAEYRDQVRAAIEAVPYAIGPAVGVDVPPTPAAFRLLSPNKILERRYVDPSNGDSFTLMIVHCGDVRDMLGHFPPVCYKGQGWNLGESVKTQVEIAGETAGAYTYHFSRAEDLFERNMTILNFFVIPETGATIFADDKAVERASRSSDLGGLGVAQFQVVIGGEPDAEWREMVVRETLLAIGPAVKTIAQGIKK